MAKRKFKRRSPYKKLKAETWEWCSRYIRIRDSIEYAQRYGLSLDSMVCQCYTCGKVYDTRKMQAGHFRSRGSGGHSGIYFDERGIKTQCHQCNAFEQGSPDEFRKRLIQEYGEAIIEELQLKHKVNKYKMSDLIGLRAYFELETKRMMTQYQIKTWW